MKKTGLALGLVVLAGCNTTVQPPAQASPPPANYRATVAAEVANAFFDPYSIRDAEISQPVYKTGIFDGTNLVPYQGWAVCVRANAKNRFGAYSGRNFSLFLFNGEAVRMTLAGSEVQGQIDNHCANVQMQPFPEIEQQAS